MSLQNKIGHCQYDAHRDKSNYKIADFGLQSKNSFSFQLQTPIVSKHAHCISFYGNQVTINWQAKQSFTSSYIFVRKVKKTLLCPSIVVSNMLALLCKRKCENICRNYQSKKCTLATLNKY